MELNRNPDNYFAEAMQGVPEFIVARQLGHFEKVHAGYAAGGSAALAALSK